MATSLYDRILHLPNDLTRELLLFVGPNLDLHKDPVLWDTVNQRAYWRRMWQWHDPSALNTWITTDKKLGYYIDALIPEIKDPVFINKMLGLSVRSVRHLRHLVEELGYNVGYWTLAQAALSLNKASVMYLLQLEVPAGLAMVRLYDMQAVRKQKRLYHRACRLLAECQAERESAKRALVVQDKA